MVYGVAAFGPQEQLAPFRGASFYFQHLAQFQNFQSGMSEIERNGDRRHAFRREPFISQVSRGPQCNAPRGEGFVELADSGFKLVPFDTHSQIAEAERE